jgi:hypothetical protein
MKKFFILFAATCIASAAWADAVYEPLEVESGFNRDVIAESLPISTHAQSYYLESGIKYSYGTKSVIQQKMGYANDTTGFPDDGKVVCISQQTYPGLFWQLAPYGGPNALCMRQKNQGGLPDRGVLSFKNIGCYQKLYFLIAAAGSSQAESIVRELNAIVYYSSGDTTHTSFNFLDHSYVTGDKAKYKACHDNFFHSDNENDKKYTNPNAYAVAREMKIDQHQLIDSICLINVSRSGQNLNPDIAIILFAVTGKTADIAAPDANPEPNHAPLRATEITQNTVSVEWDAVEGAASYRIDVATDEDFHHMVAGFNNEAVITSPDTVITGLDADHEYYWRVRAVDSEGGQSASSAPRRVRTEGTNGPKATNDDDHDLKINDITPLLNTTTNLTINRKLYKDGYYNTLCLPFDQSVADLAVETNPLYGFTIYEFDGATKIGEAQLDISVTVTDHIDAGVPYLLEWPTRTNEVLTSLEFKGVTITTDEGRTIGGPDEVQFVGNISTTGENGMENGNRNHLFIGANNELFWPNTSNGLKGFRAHFEVPASGPACVPRNSPARIVVQTNVATGVENASAKFGGSEKHLENGELVIIRDGIRYNVMGLKLR